MYNVLFVCTGNICRSPSAEGVLRHALAQRRLSDVVQVDSAGTTGFHSGEAPDARSVMHAKRRGYDIAGLRARQVTQEDFHTFDLILALDETHLAALSRLRPKDAKAELALFLSYCDCRDATEVPDPYYGGPHDFEYVLDLIESAVTPLVEKIHQLQTR
ncbi:MAG: low molecular weight phosphotyrosine protein phosphatase [Rickettsiales bacterium]|nr:low molecular weight phosphotyrosine protein phosphatase [Rickettsiales bacterium]